MGFKLRSQSLSPVSDIEPVVAAPMADVDIAVY